MKMNIVLIIIFLVGLISINLYINWLSTKIVPFSTSLPLCSREKVLQFSVKNFYSGKHAVGIFLKDKPDKKINNIRKSLRFRCIIFDENKKTTVFDREFDIDKMGPSGWGTKYIPGVDVGFFNSPSSDADIKYVFFSKYFVKYNVNIEILDSSQNLCDYNPTLGFFCTDIDQGYFGFEYIIYNSLYIIFWIVFGLFFFAKRKFFG